MQSLFFNKVASDVKAKLETNFYTFFSNLCYLIQFFTEVVLLSKLNDEVFNVPQFSTICSNIKTFQDFTSVTAVITFFGKLWDFLGVKSF